MCMLLMGCGSAGSTPLLLDTVTGAVAAYSLRKLRAAYSGSAIRVRRSSDNAEQNIGFVSGVLDTASLLTFCGAGDGFITTWYDQIGNVDYLQSTSASQPQIVSSGSVLTENSKPVIVFNVDWLEDTTTNLVDGAGVYSLFSVSSRNDATNGFVYTSQRSSKYSASLYLNVTTSRYIHGNGVDVNANCLVGTNDFDNLESGLGTATWIYRDRDIGTPLFYVNGSQKTVLGSSQTSEVTGSTGGYIGRTLTQYHRGPITEIILFDSNQSANRTTIESDQMSYYGIL